MLKTPLKLGYVIAAGIYYPMMRNDYSPITNWVTLNDAIGDKNIVYIRPIQPLHTTIVRELEAKQFAIAKRCLPPLHEVPNAIVKDYVLYQPKDKDYEAVVQRIEIPVFREVHDVIADAFSLREHYPFELHVTLMRFKKGKGKRGLSIIEEQYQHSLAFVEVTEHYYYFNPDGSWVTQEGLTDENLNTSAA